jgi:CBS domain-containing protein
MYVSKILESKQHQGVLTIEPGVSIGDAAAELSARRIGALVVSQDGREAVGILSERDIVRELGRRGAAVLAEKVSQLMTADLECCGPADRSDAIMTRMTEGRFRHMPVVDGDGALVGVISLGDVVKARLTEVSMEKDALESMIMGNA